MDWKCVRTPPPTLIHRLKLQSPYGGIWRWGFWDFEDVDGDFGTTMRFGRWWGYEIIRRVQRSSLLSFHHMRVQWKDSHMQPGRGPLPLQFGSTLIFPASKTMRSKFLLFTSHSIYDIFLEEPKLSVYFF